MQLHLMAVGTRMPDWVELGFREYQRRLPREMELVLHEIALAKRNRSAPVDKLREEEGKAMLKAVPGNCRLVALDVTGKPLSTDALAAKIPDWRMAGNDVALCVGGPDGLAPAVIDASQERWSLSAMTLPHPLVRIIIAEQLYRAWSIYQGHPYHR
jgi:23S rRNA (pseudouridine1915-N3)-methyltransferase